ncbi:hypothetical protein JHN55_16295 [Streptomyces sp. MBT56]|uniref:hypothetical protein n=1 Tax=unclassified Streptomyces TaxID=2593676 RepID=UPI00190DD5FD|nr:MULTISPECIES: hypothetical protein [unclassified Streptomyces]MBK3558064.1 hypothetical protein [Streptomyces sp. MBT56]MBK3605369.1 hypothetical protein [Streptomyces sp. MBT54]MBK3619977.1 hypothetical protein [Streptomyces sp. MBT98]
MNEPLVQRHWLTLAAPKVAPALATSTVLILGRIWNANGAEHSVGNAALMVVLATGAASAGAFASAGRAGDPVIAGTAFAASGGLALAGVAGYADGLPLPLLLWVLATATAYGIAARYWRTDRRDTVAYDRQTTVRREEHGHVERVEALRAGAQIEVARSGAAYAEQLATALITRAALPGFNPQALTDAGLPELPPVNITKEH